MLLSSLSTPLSSSTFWNPTMCHSLRRSTSGWDLRLGVLQVHIYYMCQSLWTYFHSHDRDTSTPPGSSWRKYSKSWRRRRFEGWREICWRREQRGEERKVNLLLSQKMQSMVFFQSDEQNSVFYLKVEEHLFNCHCKLSIQGTKTFVRRKITFVKEFALNF